MGVTSWDTQLDWLRDAILVSTGGYQKALAVTPSVRAGSGFGAPQDGRRRMSDPGSCATGCGGYVTIQATREACPMTL